MSWRAYVGVIDALPSTRRVIAVDPPGHGRSARLGSALDSGHQADHLARWLDHLGISDIDLIGHSMGAFTAARLASRRPGTVRSLTLLSPSPDVRWPRFRSHVAAIVRGAPGESPYVLVQAATDYVRANLFVLKGFWADMSTPAADLVSGIGSPLMVVRGSDDLVSSDAWCSELAECAAGVLRTVRGGAHGLPQQDPTRVVDLVIAFTDEITAHN